MLTCVQYSHGAWFLDGRTSILDLYGKFIRADIQRRSLEYEERNYLVETGYITETQSNLGLLAVKSDDVLIIMQDEYPAKYKVCCFIVVHNLYCKNNVCKNHMKISCTKIL